MKRSGWKPGEPLGKTMQGILRPVEVKIQQGRAGIGFVNILENITELVQTRFELLLAEKAVIDNQINTVFDEDQKVRELMSTSRPDIMVNCEGLEVRAMVDSGSDVTCINEDFFKEFMSKNDKLPMIPVKGFQVRGAVGQRSSKVNRQINLNVRLTKELAFDAPFLIIPGLVRPMILGYDFMLTNKINIQCRNDKGINFEKDNREHFVPFIEPVAINSIEPEVEVERSNSFEDEIKVGSNIGSKGKTRLVKLLKKFGKLFSTKLGRCNCYEHEIIMLDNTPIVKRSYPVPYAYTEKMEQKLKEMEEMGIITRASTPYSSPLTFALKKDGSIRVLLDARGINKYMVAETEKPPMQIDVLNSFHGANFITTIDLNNAYFQIPINVQGRKYTGFTFSQTCLEMCSFL
ncbi:hypothetical protein O0L34_g19229 [Tuta absoluta]|nr:hypothetical protein O0L34_g19229 [Tuta absoluta]